MSWRTDLFFFCESKIKKTVDKKYCLWYNNLVLEAKQPKDLYGGIAQLARALGSYPGCRWFKSNCRYHFWPVGQEAKTPPFHGGNMGSIPVRVTTIEAPERLYKAFWEFSFLPKKSFVHCLFIVLDLRTFFAVKLQSIGDSLGNLSP